MPYIQNPQQKRPPLDRKEHIWYAAGPAGCGKWKCVLCGAVTNQPPEHPAKPAWMPDKYEPLTDAERALSPYKCPTSSSY